ncbi:hypothetical protein IVA80_10315 [Bradyrhizobium sp. 139]|uniref:hypothetical protein n=1 Tax=Bradyrhizobium sp. 139 TaxID=2782616 RepID=UPI001FF7CD2C|nr:hypothetical protein [Bradyrhizobium sp. 139]MCK1741250.1 hypothetical protein [Bradyrhizobium sp. 139]
MSYAELSFQFAKEIATQLITLSSALIAVSVTFLKDFRSDNLKPLRISWGLYIAAIVCGVWTLMTLTGTLEGLSAPGKTFAAFADSTRVAAAAQIIFFIAGTISLVVFGWSHALERQAPGGGAAIIPPGRSGAAGCARRSSRSAPGGRSRRTARSLAMVTAIGVACWEVSCLER